MRMHRAVLLSGLFVSASLVFSVPIVKAQNVTARITEVVNNEQRVTLRGNTYPLARPEYDRGAAPDTLPMERMLLVLTRSPEQEAVLTTLLDEQQDKSSPNFHTWLTPEQFGRQFGPADADIQAVTGWLTSQGFRVNGVAKGRTVIEFSGDAGLVRHTFHTQIHKYVVSGEEHWANASDPEIPAALAPVVGGIDSLHNFRRKPMHHVVGVFSRSKAIGEVKQANPEFTYPNPGIPPAGCVLSSTSCYALGPYDFATIYNVLPLWNSGIDGTGETIAIVAHSDINIQDVRDFRSLFGLPAKDPQTIVNGTDPGNTHDDVESEAVLDVEWSGAIAKNATIDLVVSASTNPTSGADLSAAYIVDNNLAPVMSMSLGLCELFLGIGGNQTYAHLWQQAAAQGMTVFVAAGDSGAASCDTQDNLPPAPALVGLEVNGIASTPYNIAVGGTDFNDLTDATTFWNSTNNSTTQASAKGYIPETTWNQSCTNFEFGPNPETNCNVQMNADFVVTVGGGGGASNCTTSDGQHVASCSGGYPKPTQWQAGNGVPNDGKRDIPDVSLFASDGFNSSFYIICQSDQTNSSCNLNSPFTNFLGIGGTSASSPAFAGIMALVNQKTGMRQGNANYVFYKLAAEPGSSCASSGNPGASCIFYDVTSGTNAMPCLINFSPNCNISNPADIYGILSGFSATPGYDLATGLGSVNAANLVNNWSTTRSTPSTIALTLSPINISQGTAVNVNITVTGAGAGTPTGDVGLIANTGANGQTGVTLANFTLSGGTLSTTATSSLPVGSYTVVAHYEGDGTFLPSDSAPVQITVTGGVGTGFSLSPNPATVNIAAAGQSISSTITVTGTGGFTGTVSFACSISPVPANDPPTCFANPSSIALSATTTTASANLRISTTAGLNSGLRPEKGPNMPGHFGASMGFVLVCISMLGLSRPRKHWTASLGLVVLVLMGVALSSCASGSGGSSQINFGTPSGGYTVTLTASGGGTSQTTSVAVTVQ
jgi:subtilase family serine protease